MNITKNLPFLAVLAVLAGGAAVVIFNMAGPGNGGGGSPADIQVPELSPLAETGRTAFGANCAACHGVNGGGGTELGPPLIHRIYNPGHHGDMAFVFAARRGVPQHHWQFGNMPPQPQVKDADIKAIIRFMREMQLANGIKTKPHNM